MQRIHRWSISVGLLLFGIILFIGGLLRPIQNGIRRILLPLVRGTADTASSVSNQFGLLAPTKLSPEQLFDIEGRLSRLAIDYVKLRSLEEENKSLRAQAKFLSASGYDSVGARVISREIGQDHAILLIDRGLHDHVEKGQAVVTNEGIFIGKIGSISERISTVELLTDPKSRVAAAVAEEKKLIGVVEGRGNGAAALTYIPSSEVLARDQMVITAGTEQKIPGNLILGIINQVQGKPTDPFLTAAIEPIISGDAVVFVSILRPTALRPTL
ncbi:rod shape-determining protein MreC [Candidatus Uhrbacteria bacterium]|nr:rod shape-determining protein MreC [Candidatus Uhrbacteria bacterium]